MRTAEGKDTPGRETEPGTGPRSARLWRFALAGLIGTWAVLGCVALITMPLSPPRAASATHPATPVPPTIAGPVFPSPATHAAPRPLTAAGVSAFGPQGTLDGDNPGIVARIVSASAAASASAAGDSAAWYTSWYATPQFGNLKAGTGLLVDMGRAVTVSSVQLVLGPQAGADIQLRVGNSPSPAALGEAGAVSGVGGRLRVMASHPVKGRYVLIWFTRLPPRADGKYQVNVYGLTVNGTAG